MASGLGLTAQSNIAYKNLLGKSLTTVANGIFNESVGISFNITSNNIWLSQIPSSPASAVSAGIAVQVTGSMSAVSGANNFSYNLLWPTTPPSGIDPLTNSAFAYNSGSLTGINSGTNITNAISDSYGASYIISVNGTSGLISAGDNRNWLYQYNSGIYFQESNANTTGTPVSGTVYVYIGPTLQSQPTTPFSYTSSISQTSVGGLNSGSTFNSVNTNNILLNMLYPSLQPNITSFTIGGFNNSYEVGQPITIGSYSMNWTISNTSSLVSNNVYITTYNNVSIGPLGNSGGFSYSVSSPILYTSPRTITFTMSALQNSGIRISSPFNVNWLFKTYYGSSTSTNFTSISTGLQNLPYNILTSSIAGSYTFNFATSSYKFIAIPDAFTLSSIFWNGVPVAMADTTDGYTWSANNLNYSYLTGQLNSYSVGVNYKIYRSKYMLAATMSNVIIS